ncbi:MAG: 4Fe-4S binding protein [Peptococcaceae bacterium]|jgi:pyruvate ferredoxin oxidoreductase delta subunit|nr:4Fe-4S binding protein [Peptococcaceae bacterium]
MNKKIVQPISRPVIGAGGLTGTWRTQRPVYDASLCNACLLCWLYCPEVAISKEDRTIDYTYCKGCGICAAECPKKAIYMEREESR